MRRSDRASVSLAASGIALAALLAPAAVASAAPVSYPAVVDEGITVVTPFPNYELRVDCDAFLAQYDIDGLGFYGELISLPEPFGSLTIIFDCELDLEDFEISDLSDLGDDSSIGAGPDGNGGTVVAIPPNTEFSVLWPSSDAEFEVEYYQTALLPNPGGSLLHELDLSHPGASGPLADFAIDGEGPVDDCANQGSKPYVTQVFTVVTAGTYTFRATGYTPYEGGLEFDNSPAGEGAPPNPWGTYNPFADPVFVLYSTFNPANTDAGFIECNDDSDAIEDLVNEAFDGDGAARDGQNRFLDDYSAELIVDLAPGTYTLVTIPYNTPDVAPEESSAKFAPAFLIDDLGLMTTQSEIWGQPGGLVLGSQLAATGVTTNAAVGLAGLAGVLVAVGVAGVVVRRRRTA